MKALVSARTLAGTLAIVVPAWGEPPEAPARAAELGRKGDASVSVGVVGARQMTRSELAAYVGVTVPLERVLARRPRAATATAAREPEGVDDTAPEPSVASVASAAARDESGDPSDIEPGTLVPALAPEILSRLARDAVAAAENAHRLAEREGELDGLATRARWSAVLPEVRVRAARSRDDSLHLQPTLEDPYRYSTIGGDGLLLEAQVTFRLNRLVFADEEVAVERLRIVRERAGEDRAERVTARLVRWHRALSREVSLGDPPARGRAALERVEMEMELDVLTDGWFGERVRRLLTPAPSQPTPKGAAPPRPGAPAKAVSERSAIADLEASPASATSASPCLPKLATDSRTFCGASMR